MPLNGDTDGSRFKSLFIPGKESPGGARRPHGNRARRPGGARRRVQVRGSSRHIRGYNPCLRTFLRTMLAAQADSGRQDPPVPPHRPGRTRKGRDTLTGSHPRHPRSPLAHRPCQATRRANPSRGGAQPYDEPDRRVEPVGISASRPATNAQRSRLGRRSLELARPLLWVWPSWPMAPSRPTSTSRP
jgi:hypothetical protein